MSKQQAREEVSEGCRNLQQTTDRVSQCLNAQKKISTHVHGRGLGVGHPLPTHARTHVLGWQPQQIRKTKTDSGTRPPQRRTSSCSRFGRQRRNTKTKSTTCKRRRRRRRCFVFVLFLSQEFNNNFFTVWASKNKCLEQQAANRQPANAYSAPDSMARVRPASEGLSEHAAKQVWDSGAFATTQTSFARTSNVGNERRVIADCIQKQLLRFSDVRRRLLGQALGQWAWQKDAHDGSRTHKSPRDVEKNRVLDVQSVPE